MRVLVTGSGGLLARELLRAVPSRGMEVVGLTRADLDVTDAGAVAAALAEHRPGVVVHCAAYTAVDAAESDPDGAYLVNRDSVAHVARAAVELDALVVLPSTDYVFDGAKGAPYLPHDPPRPLNVYGASKLAGEEVLAGSGARHLVVRTSWLYGAGGRNFVRVILSRARAGGALEVVSDQTGRPTWARNLAGAILDLVGLGAQGIWHVADGGTATWHDLASESVRLAGLDVAVRPVSSDHFGSPARRPRYSVLDLTRTEEALGRAMMPWKEALALYLGEDLRVHA